MMLLFEGIFIGITTQERIQVFHPAKIGTDGNVLDGTAVPVRAFGQIPGAFGLLPGNLAGRGGKINIHIGAGEFVH